MPLRLVALNSDRSIWLTRRPSEASPWDPWLDLTSALGPIGDPNDVACAIVDGRLHICVHAFNDELWHTMETGPGTFTGWGAAHSVAFSGLELPFRVDCAAVGPQLHVCVDGRTRSGAILSQPAVWRSIRAPSGSWSQRREVTGRNPVYKDIGCATITPAGAGARPQLEILARALDRSGTEALIHTTLLPTGGSSGDANIVAGGPSAATTDFSRVKSLASAGIGTELHIVVAANDDLFHTVLGSAGGVAELFTSVRVMVNDPSFTGTPGTPLRQLIFPACANVGGNLHVCALSAGQIFHTIRLASGLWRNPESSPVGVFGDVTAAVPGGPSTPFFISIACAGDPL
jgi:hypothetical protein